jgi:hypothetical protein
MPTKTRSPSRSSTAQTELIADRDWRARSRLELAIVWVRKLGLPCKQRLPAGPTEFTHPTRKKTRSRQTASPSSDRPGAGEARPLSPGPVANAANSTESSGLAASRKMGRVAHDSGARSLETPPRGGAGHPPERDRPRACGNSRSCSGPTLLTLARVANGKTSKGEPPSTRTGADAQARRLSKEMVCALRRWFAHCQVPPNRTRTSHLVLPELTRICTHWRRGVHKLGPSR